MSIIKEFKEFAMKGNVVDLAVGVIIGVAFGKVVTSVVNDIIMPPIGKVMGGVNFTDLFLSLDPSKLAKDGSVIKSLAQAKEAGAAVIAYGSFINTVIDFTIVAFCIFMIVKVMNSLKKKPLRRRPACHRNPPGKRSCWERFATSSRPVPILAQSVVDNARLRQAPNVEAMTLRSIFFPLFAGATLVLTPPSDAASLLERLGLGKSKSTNLPATVGTGTALTQDQMVGGLKEALGKGVRQAVASLGKQDGFLKDAGVKIPMPESLQKVEKTLRTLRQDKLADEFVTTMNRAAEQAVPEGAAVLGDSVQQMSIADAKSILTGTNNAATQYFRRTSETNLHARFLPIVKAATENAGVTGAYKRMTDKAGGGLSGLGGSLFGKEAPDLDSYVTRKTLDGLFLKIAEQEKQIRENPVARTTDLLQKVFGAVGR